MWRNEREWMVPRLHGTWHRHKMGREWDENGVFYALSMRPRYVGRTGIKNGKNTLARTYKQINFNT